jgi:hypothetical protein
LVPSPPKVTMAPTCMAKSSRAASLESDGRGHGAHRQWLHPDAQRCPAPDGLHDARRVGQVRHRIHTHRSKTYQDATHDCHYLVVRYHRGVCNEAANVATCRRVDDKINRYAPPSRGSDRTE